MWKLIELWVLLLVTAAVADPRVRAVREPDDLDIIAEVESMPATDECE